MVANGKRYLPGKFPTKNLDQMKNPTDMCNNFRPALSLTRPGTS